MLERDFPTIQGVILVFSFVYVLITCWSTCRTSSSTRASATDMDAPGLKQYEALSVEAAAVRRQETMWQRLHRSWSVRLGGAALVVLVMIALAAPWLGTVDPALFDAGSRDLLPGKIGDITTLEGDLLQHKFLMGSDSFGRDIYSRVIYGTRVSLIVGILETGPRVWGRPAQRSLRSMVPRARLRVRPGTLSGPRSVARERGCAPGGRSVDWKETRVPAGLLWKGGA